MSENRPNSGAPGATPPQGSRLRRWLFGRPRSVTDRSLFHRLSLIPFLAWVGLGADGLSSSAYGPAEAFLALGEHSYLAVLMMIAVPATVLIIASAYARIIDAFPHGGGGYVVATKLLGPGPGVVSGSALVIDYVLTITVSIAAAGDAIFSMLPPQWAPAKLPIEVCFILIGIGLNIRGIKETVLPLVPIFLLFLVTHAMLIVLGIVREIPHAAETAQSVGEGFSRGASTIGMWGMLLLFVRAYSLGAGTYTGIEAVSNGLSILREPRLENGRKTMRYMSVSLAVTAAGLVLCFLLANVRPAHGSTLNAVLGERVVEGWSWGPAFVWALMISEAAILVVAAQAGFIDGPRVLANMALDGWVPRRFASLSERLTTQNGIVLMGAAAIVALLYTGGHVHTLVVMYSINVFITFTLSMLSMLRATFQKDWERKRRTRDRILFGAGLLVCSTILVGTSVMKFTEGGWITLAVTAGFVGLCFLIRAEYRGVSKRVRRLETELTIPEGAASPTPPAFDASKPTAAIFVGGYSGLGVHTLIQAMSLFGGHFKNALFLSVGVVDSGAMRSPEEIAAKRAAAEADVARYVALANRLGIPASSRIAIGIDAVDELEQMSIDVAREFPRVTFVAGQLVFRREQFHHALLHNQTAFALQRRLQWQGYPVLILPIRVR